MSWLRKYSPNRSSEVLCEGDVDTIIKWFQNFAKGNKQPPLLVIGLPGIGKTTLIKLLAKENNLAIVHIPTLQDIPPKSTITGRIIYHISIYRLEEYFIKELLKLMKNRINTSDENIIVETTSVKVPRETLKKLFIVARLRPSPLDDIARRLKSIVEKEGLKADEELIKDIIRYYDYDIRSAIQVLELILRYRLSSIKEMFIGRTAYHSLCDFGLDFIVPYLILRNLLRRLAVLDSSQTFRFISELIVWKSLIENARIHYLSNEICHWELSFLYLYQSIINKSQLKLGKEKLLIDEFIYTIQQELNYGGLPFLL